MSKTLLLIVTLVVILITAFVTFFVNTFSSKSLSKSEIDTAVNQAKHLYRQEKQKGRDFSLGPCLSNALMPDWVVDIVHNPRAPIDDLSENQCPAYREGTMRHFVELDIEGNLIRAK